jgi:uncharacterized protein YkwD
MMRFNHAGKSGLLLLGLMLVSGIPDRRNDSLTNNAFGSTPEPASSAWKRETVDTTTGADYMTQTERDVVVEINKMRSDPALYSKKYIVPLRAYYDGKLLKYPGKIAIATSEGASALEECIRELEHAKPASCMSPRKGLTLAARDHAQDQGRTGATGHNGSDGSSIVTRINRYGSWQLSAGENISYGYNEARAIVVALLIDDGVPSRGHRKNLLNNSFNLIGVDIGPHRVYGEVCVMDFAGGYTSK